MSIISDVKKLDDRDTLMMVFRYLTYEGRQNALYAYDGHHRNLVLNSGANVTLYTGELRENAATCQERLADIELALIRRRNVRTGKPDGMGALGGLSERTAPEYFNSLSANEKLELVGQKDDVVLGDDGQPQLITDIHTISMNNIQRETREELSERGIEPPPFDPQAHRLVNLEGVKDDRFILTWNGENPPADKVYAVTPYCYTRRLDTGLFNRVFAQRQTAAETGEVYGLEAVPLFEALQRWGARAPSKVEEAGFSNIDDLDYNYRYPHEYIAAWAIASDCLGNDPEAMIHLAREVQTAIFDDSLGRGHTNDNLLGSNFGFIAHEMKVGLNVLDKALNLPDGTVAKMKDAADKAVRDYMLNYMKNGQQTAPAIDIPKP